MLPDTHPDKIYHLTGVNDIFEEPVIAYLILYTDRLNTDEACVLIVDFLMSREDSLY